MNLVEMVEIDGDFYSGASLSYKDVPFFAATIRELPEDDENYQDYRREMEIRLHDALVKAQEEYIWKLWLRSPELRTFNTTHDFGVFSAELVSWAAPGYKIHWQENYYYEEEFYILVTIYYNSLPIVILSHPQVSVVEVQDLLPKFAERVRCEIEINEINLKPDVAFVTEIADDIVSAPAPVKPKLRRNHNRHINSNNIIGEMGERVTRSRARRV